MKLEEYLEWQGMTRATFGKKVNATESTVSRWCSHKRIPRTTKLPEIEDASDGHVRGEDFYPERRSA